MPKMEKIPAPIIPPIPMAIADHKPIGFLFWSLLFIENSSKIIDRYYIFVSKYLLDQIAKVSGRLGCSINYIKKIPLNAKRHRHYSRLSTMFRVARQVLHLSIKNAFEEVKPGPSHDFSFIMPVYALREVLKVCFFKI